MTTVNWGKLFEAGRCKAIGIPWSLEELKAVYELKIPAEYVRQGILTVDRYEKAKAEKTEPSKSRDELMEEAKKEGINVTPEATVESLKQVIEAKKPAIKIKAKPVKKTVKRK